MVPESMAAPKKKPPSKPKKPGKPRPSPGKSHKPENSPSSDTAEGGTEAKRQAAIEALLQDFTKELMKVFSESVVRAVSTVAEGGGAQGTFATAGRSASKVVQRSMLLAELKRQDWNLTATGEALGLGSPANVLRAIRSLDLTAEYDAAKHAGKIGPGSRRKDEKTHG